MFTWKKHQKNNCFFPNLSSDFMNKRKKVMLLMCWKWFFLERIQEFNFTKFYVKQSQTSVDCWVLWTLKRWLGPSAATRQVSHFPLLLTTTSVLSTACLHWAKTILILYLHLIHFLAKLISISPAIISLNHVVILAFLISWAQRPARKNF